MQDITVLLVVASLVGLVVQYWIRTPPMYLITSILSVGGLASVIDDYTADLLADTPAMILTIVCVSVVVFSVINYVTYYMPGRK